ncbi:unnamed protein product [Rangifer tarandus platyrhynchus]|uniref:Uncharacterized protein n=1 Tax=Rangifer tarandus platyrhynchus TaxID=3082113 RepID=A0AC59Z3Z9_RANTA
MGRGHRALAGLPVASGAGRRGQFRPPRAPPAASTGKGLGLPPVPSATGPGPAPPPGRERAAASPGLSAFAAVGAPGTPGACFQPRPGPSPDGGGRSRAGGFRAETRVQPGRQGEEASGAWDQDPLVRCSQAQIPSRAGSKGKPKRGHVLERGGLAGLLPGRAHLAFPNKYTSSSRWECRCGPRLLPGTTTRSGDPKPVDDHSRTCADWWCAALPDVRVLS